MQVSNVMARQRHLFANSMVTGDVVGGTIRRALSESLIESYRQIVSVLRPELAIEIGAYEGSFSRFVKQQLPSARVVAFEANPHVYSRFASAPELRDSGVEYLNLAVSEACGVVDFMIPRSVAGKARPVDNRMGSLLRHSADHSTYDHHRVAATTLDDFFVGSVPDRCVLWIDVEGAVGRILAGGKLLLRSACAVYCEVETRPHWAQQMRDSAVFEALSPFGLRPAAIDSERPWQYNVILLREDILELVQVRRALDAHLTRIEAVVAGS